MLSSSFNDSSVELNQKLFLSVSPRMGEGGLDALSKVCVIPRQCQICESFDSYLTCSKFNSFGSGLSR